jgi:hypothetical protein
MPQRPLVSRSQAVAGLTLFATIALPFTPRGQSLLELLLEMLRQSPAGALGFAMMFACPQLFGLAVAGAHFIRGREDRRQPRAAAPRVPAEHDLPARRQPRARPQTTRRDRLHRLRPRQQLLLRLRLRRGRSQRPRGPVAALADPLGRHADRRHRPVAAPPAAPRPRARRRRRRRRRLRRAAPCIHRASARSSMPPRHLLLDSPAMGRRSTCGATATSARP